jgi:EmrB/QacA subfamily drug resistance transporter
VERRWKILILTSLGLFMASLDLFIVNLAFPDIATDFGGTSLAELSWVLNAYAIVFAALLVPAGRVADRIGRKRVFLAGMVAFTAGSALCAVSPSVELLVASRVLQAAGGAMIMPTTLGLILPEFPVEQRAVAVGAWSAVGGVAAAFGPAIGGVLVELSWRWIFLVNLPVGVLTVVLGVRLLDEIREPEGARTPDALGAGMLAAGIGLLTAGIVQGPDWGWGDARTVGSFAAAVALIAAFLARSSQHPAPVIELSLLRIRPFAVANLASLAFFAGFGAMLLSTVLLLTQVWGYSVLETGLAIAPGPLMAAIVAAATGRIVAKVGPRLPGALGGVVFAASFLWFVLRIDASPDYAGVFLPGFVVGGAGVGLALGSLPAAATAPLPPDRFSTGTGVFGMSRQLGAALGVAILVAIVGDAVRVDLLDRLDAVWVFALAMGLATTAGSLALGLPRADPAAGREAVLAEASE